MQTKENEMYWQSYFVLSSQASHCNSYVNDDKLTLGTPATPERPNQSSGGSGEIRTQEPAGNKGVSSEADADLDDDEYDEEFISSAHNHYADYYFNEDSDSEAGVTPGIEGANVDADGVVGGERDLEQGGSSLLHDDHVDEHTSLITHGNRFRADSLQLAKDPPKKGAIANRMERL